MRSGLVSFKITQQRNEIKGFCGGNCQTPCLTPLEPPEGLVALAGAAAVLSELGEPSEDLEPKPGEAKVQMGQVLHSRELSKLGAKQGPPRSSPTEAVDAVGQILGWYNLAANASQVPSSGSGGGQTAHSQ